MRAFLSSSFSRWALVWAGPRGGSHCERLASLGRTEILLDERHRLVDVEVAGNAEDGVVGAVVPLVEVLHPGSFAASRSSMLPIVGCA